MAVTHYDPYPDAEETEVAMCGTKVGENYYWSSHWASVSCKKCLKTREKIKSEMEHVNTIRNEQDASFMDFIANGESL